MKLRASTRTVPRAPERWLSLACSLHERVFAWMMLVDERNIAAAYVAGEPRYRRDALPA